MTTESFLAHTAEKNPRRARFVIPSYRPFKDLPLTYTKDAHGNAGFDLYATEVRTLAHGDITKIPVNAHFAIPAGYFGFVVPRSGLSLEGINIIPGTIDSSYRGQVNAIVQYFFKESWVKKIARFFTKTERPTYKIERGMRIAQVIFIRHEIPIFEEVDTLEELGETDRGLTGFGQSGLY